MAELTGDKTKGKTLHQDVNEVENTVLDEMRQISKIFRDEPEFYELFMNPDISNDEKKDLVRNVFEGRIGKETYNFLRMFIDFQHVVDEELKVSAGTIFSVEPLTEVQLSTFEEKTGKLINQRVKLTNKIDPSILGGVKIIIDEKIIDASIRKRLQDLEGSIKRV